VPEGGTRFDTQILMQQWKPNHQPFLKPINNMEEPNVQVWLESYFNKL